MVTFVNIYRNIFFFKKNISNLNIYIKKKKKNLKYKIKKKKKRIINKEFYYIYMYSFSLINSYFKI